MSSEHIYYLDPALVPSSFHFSKTLSPSLSTCPPPWGPLLPHECEGAGSVCGPSHTLSRHSCSRTWPCLPPDTKVSHTYSQACQTSPELLTHTQCPSACCKSTPSLSCQGTVMATDPLPGGCRKFHQVSLSFLPLPS